MTTISNTHFPIPFVAQVISGKINQVTQQLGKEFRPEELSDPETSRVLQSLNRLFERFRQDRFEWIQKAEMHLKFSIPEKDLIEKILPLNDLFSSRLDPYIKRMIKIIHQRNMDIARRQGLNRS